MQLAYETQGAGSPLLILHGLFGSARNWTAVAKHLADSYRVYHVDLRNHGNSPHADSMTYDEMAADVRGFILEQGLTGAAIVGHSMGGKTAMTLALRHADLIGPLAVVDIAPTAYQPHHAELIAAMQATDLSGLQRRAEADARLAQRIADAGLRAFLGLSLMPAGSGFSWQFNLPAIAANLGALSGFPEFEPGETFAGATLFVIGALSNYVRPQHHATIHARFPKAEIAAIAGASHWVHAEQRDAFVARLREFLQSAR